VGEKVASVSMSAYKIMRQRKHLFLNLCTDKKMTSAIG